MLKGDSGQSCNPLPYHIQRWCCSKNSLNWNVLVWLEGPCMVYVSCPSLVSDKHFNSEKFRFKLCLALKLRLLSSMHFPFGPILPSWGELWTSSWFLYCSIISFISLALLWSSEDSLFPSFVKSFIFGFSVGPPFMLFEYPVSVWLLLS